ncbi:MAG: glycoside hydrolase family 3 N-terminal domain-containing protein, partial [Bacillota bacterium]|nr:glycoside hydrolase family 3 N-terminal domain-containing protein [Bacillota bacterium]
EIYLKGFEIAVKEGGAYSIMTTYGSLNGLWTAGNYDLNTTILRREWGFDGIVMTDWWAKINDEGIQGTRENTTAMVRAQNDLYMVCGSPAENSNKDNTMKGLADGIITRGELQRNAANIIKVLMRSAVMERVSRGEEEESEEMEPGDAPEILMANYRMEKLDEVDLSQMDTTRGKATLIGVHTNVRGEYKLTLEIKASGGELAQVPVSIYVNNVLLSTVTIQGTGEWQKVEKLCQVIKENNYIKFYFGQSGMKFGKMTFKPLEAIK